MNKLIYIFVILSVSLTGCLHHKRKREKHIKSQERQIHPEIQKYHEEKQKYEGIKVVEIPIQKNEETRQEIINSAPNFPEKPKEDKKKPETSWWPWD